MTLVKYTPKSGIAPFSNNFNRLFGEFWPQFFGEGETGDRLLRPTVDIEESDHEVVIRADMPGIDKKDIKVTVNDGTLTIEGSRTGEHEEKKNSFTRCERFMGTFSRAFNLPAWVDGSKVQADYKNGVLTVTMPKTEEAKPKQIEVKVS